MTDSGKPTLSVGAVVFRGDRVLLIRRGRPPFQNHWSIPGGKVEHGESLRDAVRREVEEEAGIEIEVRGLIDAFEALPTGNEPRHFVMIDFVAEHLSGEPRPGDDALEAEFVSYPEALSRLAWDKTRLALQGAMAFRRANAPSLAGRVE